MKSYNLISTSVKNEVELRKNKIGNVNLIYFKKLSRKFKILTCTKLDILYGVRLINRYMEILD